jgi:hypothetical protein
MNDLELTNRQVQELRIGKLAMIALAAFLKTRGHPAPTPEQMSAIAEITRVQGNTDLRWVESSVDGVADEVLIKAAARTAISAACEVMSLPKPDWRKADAGMIQN